MYIKTHENPLHELVKKLENAFLYSAFMCLIGRFRTTVWGLGLGLRPPI